MTARLVGWGGEESTIVIDDPWPGYTPEQRRSFAQWIRRQQPSLTGHDMNDFEARRERQGSILTTPAQYQVRKMIQYMSAYGMTASKATGMLEPKPTKTERIVSQPWRMS